jgi:hypothetical protein
MPSKHSLTTQIVTESPHLWQPAGVFSPVTQDSSIRKAFAPSAALRMQT